MNVTPDTRQRILESARDLIYARSYADVGVAAICDSAGVKKGSLYHFFPSKRDLTLAVIDVFLVEFNNRIFDQAFDDSIPPMGRFTQLAELAYLFQKSLAVETGHTLGCPFGNIAVEMSTQDEVLRQKVEVIFNRMEQLFRETLETAIAQGDIGAIDVPATASAMVAYAEGVMLMAKTRNDPELIRQLLPAMSDIRITA
ncbi:MAG: TetR/AcrR family transcriptional regulator [Candidatus Thiodiazotropha sp.]